MEDTKADSQPQPPATPPGEPKPDEKQPEYSYVDVHKETPKQIAENKELPEEKPPEEKPDEKKPEEKPAEAPKPPEEEGEEAELSPEEAAEEIKEKAKAKLIEELKPKAKDEYEEFAKTIWEKENREPTWKEALEFMRDKTIEKIDKREAEKKAEEEKKAKETSEANEELNKRFNEQVDEELKELYDRKQLTPVEDEKNPDDQGVVERKALFQKMLDINQQRATEGKPPILSIQRIFYGYYEKPSNQPAGANAPVSMGKGTAPSGEGEIELDYLKDVRKPWSFFRGIMPGRKT